MFFIVVVGYLFAQVFIQCHCIEKILEVVIFLRHNCGELFVVIVLNVGSEEIRLPVDQVKRILKLEDEINKAPHKASGRRKVKVSDLFRKVSGEILVTVF